MAVKRPRLQGGNVKFEQTCFKSHAEAIAEFEDQIYKFFRESKKAEEGMFARIKFEIHWEPEATAKRYNHWLKEKDVAGRGARPGREKHESSE